MQVPAHPLLSLVESNKNGLKSMLTHYIDATVDSQFASLRNSIETMIQSGMIGPQQSYNVIAFGTTLLNTNQENTHQSSAQCWNECSNDTLTRAQERQNTLPMIKQEFDDEEEEVGDVIDDDSAAKCEKRIYSSGDDAETRKNEDKSYDTTQHNVHVLLENNQTTQLINSNDISPSPTNLINTEPLIKQECFQGLSINSIPMDFPNNATQNISIDEQIEGENIQIQTDEFEDNADGANEHLHQDICANEVCILDHDTNNHLDDDVSAGDGDETNLVANLVGSQFQIDISVTNNTQMNIQNDVLNNEQSTPSTSGVRSSARKHVRTKVFGDLAQSNVNPQKSGKRKSDQANKSVKKTKRKQILDDDQDEDTDSGEYDDQEGHANNAIGEEIATSNPIQPNLVQSNRQFQCQHCHKSFDFKFNFQRHLLVHTGERPFHCDQCDKRFSLKSNLTKHQLIHQNIKPFQCVQCGKHFRQRCALAIHQLSHQNIKRFQCHECEKQFTLKHQLDSHRLTHSGERPFACRHCAKSFTQWILRNNHEKAIHLHVKPYRCKQCGHTATQRSDVITHIRVVHFGLPKTIKEQRAHNIIDDRDPRELVEKM